MLTLKTAVERIALLLAAILALLSEQPVVVLLRFALLDVSFEPPLLHSGQELFLLAHFVLELLDPGVFVIYVVLEALRNLGGIQDCRVAVGTTEPVVQPLVAALFMEDMFTNWHDFHFLLVDQRIQANRAVRVLVE